MARLIDADKINYHEHTECMGNGDFETVRTVTDKEIAEIPTVDAVEVVRCKDCVTHDLCIVEDHLVFAGWKNPFCCAGKRKDGDGNG